ncbi:MAG: DUF1194 domain-containing protein [Rhodobacter sp.]|nr:DUF1194 domain-containing protein [Rhodobacter sp.]
MRLFWAAFSAVCFFGGQATACAVSLVLAMDVSRSVDPSEYRLIQHGTAEAFRHPEVIELLGWLKDGALVTVVQWSGPDQQRQMIPWRHVSDRKSVLALADEIDATARYYRFGLTSPGEALVFSATISASAPIKCDRQVIDISGDGVRNIGMQVAIVSDEIGARGMIINGLVVRGDTPDPLDFYQRQIKRGPLGFVQISDGYEDFPRAMFLKLLRELSPTLSSLQP